MADRKGERAGWTWGFFGGFLWVAVLAGFLFFRGQAREGLTGALIFSSAMAAVVYFAPWRHPSASAWKLMLAPYALLAGSIFWAARIFGGPEKAELKWHSLLWSGLLLLPFLTGGKRKWKDGSAAGECDN